MEANNNKSNLNFAMYGQVTIESAIFRAYCIYMANESSKDKGYGKHLIKCEWINSENNNFKLSSIASYFGISTPDFINEIVLKSLAFAYYTDTDCVEFEIGTNYGNMDLISEKINGQRNCTLEFDNFSFKFSNLPIIGKLVQGEDCFCLNKFEYNPPNGEGKKSFNLDFALRIDDKDFNFCNEDQKPSDKNATLAANNHKICSGENSRNLCGDDKTEVKWIDVNKSFKVLHIDKIGAAFDGKNIIVYLNAGFSIMELQIDFYGLYFSVNLGSDAKKFDFGLKGLDVSFNRNPIAISGGLYHIIDKDHPDLYNGELMFKFGKYGFNALGSYCDNNGDPSFFLYLMLSAPLGGPPFFFIEGLALGMGINRGINLPDIKSVNKFPFVAAAMGDNVAGGLNPKSEISDVLTELSDWIYISNGEFFLTGGIKFNTFGLLNSFALVTVEFGNKLCFSLLGMSEASIPPNIDSGKSPIAYAQLALKAVIDPSEGLMEIIGSLTDESYILDKNCKVTGGFAFCSWFGGERKGDFFVSIGGCHNTNFINKDAHGNPLYPELDKVGINWQITNNLKFTAGAYFAITPACIMAGADLSLTYDAGNLKAWLNANADFFLKWKPFFYEADISISIGASYTLNVWFIHKTFTVELGASMQLWGPNFSGNIRISWFTISFGESYCKAEPISWNDFSNSFLLPNKSNTLSSGNSSTKNNINSINISEGLLKIKKDGDDNRYYVSADNLKITTNSLMPCSELQLAGVGKTLPIPVKNDNDKLGIVPMGIKDYSSTITIKFIFVDREELIDFDKLDCTVEYGNFAPALWKSDEPGINDVKSINAPMGISLKIDQSKIIATNILPKQQKEEFYKMENLLEDEPIGKSFSWNAQSLPEKKDYSKYEKDNIMTIISETVNENNVRNSIVSLLSDKFALNSKVNFKEMGEHSRNYLMAYPIIKATGGQYD